MTCRRLRCADERFVYHVCVFPALHLAFDSESSAIIETLHFASGGEPSQHRCVVLKIDFNDLGILVGVGDALHNMKFLPIKDFCRSHISSLDVRWVSIGAPDHEAVIFGNLEHARVRMNAYEFTHLGGMRDCSLNKYVALPKATDDLTTRKTKISGADTSPIWLLKHRPWEEALW